MRLQELRENRAARVAEMQGLCANAEREKRDLADNEAQRFDALKAEVRGLEGQISRAETLADMERHADATPIGGHGGAQELEARFSLGRAIADTLSGRGLQGAEREWNQEHRSARSNAFTVPTGILMPDGLGSPERRAILTTAPSGGPGGNLVGTITSPQTIDRLRPALKVQAMGATVITGLTQNLDLPRLKTSGSVAYVGEHQEGPQTDPTFDSVGLTPRTITGNYEMSRRMMIQAPQLEGILRADISYLLAQQLDTAAIGGTGGIYPTGVMATAGTKQVDFDHSGPNAIQNWINFTAAMIAAPEEANVNGNGGFLANTFTKALLNSFLTTFGEPLGWQSFFNQERVEFTNQVPNNLGAGPFTSGMVYSGSWNDLVIGYFSAVDIILNPYADSVAKKGGAYLHAFLDHDIAIRHPEAFSWSKSAPNTAAASFTAS